MIRNLILSLFLFLPFLTQAQFKIGADGGDFSYSTPKEFEIGGITVSGTETLDKNVLIMLSGLTVGDKISVPGERISAAIKSLWDQGLFADVKIVSTKVQGNNIFLDIQVEERPRLSRFSFMGVKKNEADDIREKIKLIKGKVVTDNLLVSTESTVKAHFVNKGFLNTEVEIIQKKDTLGSSIKRTNDVNLIIQVKKNGRVKIKDVNFTGNTAFSDQKLRRFMKDTKRKRWYSIFNTSKYLPENLEKDEAKIIAKYNAKGYRDAQIVRDTVYKIEQDRVNVDVTIDEGKKYYFRNIYWVGNSKHSTKELNSILNIKKGDIFDQQKLETRLFMNQDGRDVSSLYMDEGYLFFQVTPVEVLVENDSIDMEMRIYEGKQATINKVTVVGNTKTNDHVIMREIRTKPGQLFSRSDIIRSQRELAQLRYFNAEKLGVNPTPNPADGTVDIEYTVEESPSDQIELSGGWGAGRVVGTLGVSFNNFSAKNLFNGKAWRPLPAGDGQTLTLRAQSNGLFFQSYNASFIEPWLGGKKPNSFSISIYHSVQTNGVRKKEENHQSIKITGISFGLGKRLKVPDDYFTLYNEISFQHYRLNNYRSSFFFSDGYANNISHRINLSRNSVDQPIYPRSGSQISLTLQWTPPYSLFRKDSLGNKVEDYSEWSNQEKYKWVEYHKWKFTSQWFTKLAGNLVLNTKAGFGFLGMYNSNLGAAPFERFYLGGDGLSGFALDGREIIALRGYDNNSLSPTDGATVITKYTLELRYPFSLNPSATIYGLTFAEAGNSWSKDSRDRTWNNTLFNPFSVKKSVGVGIRVFLPMFGLLGLDYGWRLDEVQNRNIQKSQFHFTIGANIGDL